MPAPRLRPLAPWAVALVALGPSVAPSTASEPDALARLELRRGLNLDGLWERDPPRLGRDVTPARLARLRRLGVDFVRLPVQPERRSLPGGGLREDWATVRRVVSDARRLGLDVIVDIHPRPTVARTILAGGGWTARYRAFARAVATDLVPLLGDGLPGGIALELLNEPPRVGSAWPELQEGLRQEIRAEAPTLPLVLTGDRLAGVDGLVAARPPADPYALWTFHFYEPFSVTHQGAEWVPAPTRRLRQVPYPATRRGLETAREASLAGVRNPTARTRVLGLLDRYERAAWSPGRIGSELDRVTAWARRTGVRAFMGEFGVYPAYADRGTVLRMVTDVRRAAEARGIGWAEWFLADFADGRLPGDVRRALGLR